MAKGARAMWRTGTMLRSGMAGRLGLSIALLAALALLVACGGAGSGGASSSGAATLACSLQSEGIEIDVIRSLLTCTVSGAPASDTAFTVRYSVTDANGQTHQIATPCEGTLRAGAGACSLRFSVVVPQGLGKPSVAGETEPDQRPLGPVTPSTQGGTPQPPSPGQTVIPGLTPLSSPFPTFVPQSLNAGIPHILSSGIDRRLV